MSRSHTLSHVMEGLFLLLLSLLLAPFWGAQLPCPPTQLSTTCAMQPPVLREGQTPLLSQSKRLTTSPEMFGFTDRNFYRKITGLPFVYTQHSMKVLTRTAKRVLNLTRKGKDQTAHLILYGSICCSRGIIRNYLDLKDKSVKPVLNWERYFAVTF